MKKLIISLIIVGLIFMGIGIFKSKETTECWWGVLYPSLSYVGFEDETSATQISSVDSNYIYVKEEEPVKIKIAIVEWFKKIFE